MHNIFIESQLKTIPYLQGGKKFKETKLGQWTSRNEDLLGNIGSIGSSISGGLKGFDATQSAINTGITNAVSSIPGIGPLLSAGMGAFDAIGGALGAKIDALDSSTASKAGISSANTANQVLGALPVVGTVLGAFAGKTIDSHKSAEIDSLASAYGASTGDINTAQEMGGKKMLFGKRKANKFIDEQNRVNKLLTEIGQQNKLIKSNTMAENYASQNQNRYSGTTPQLILAKSGAKIPELELARKLLLSWSQTKLDNPEKLKEGGKIKNIIVEGALHARKHHLEDKNSDLEGSITNKGIPVISKTTTGKITQQAEIEGGELVLTLDVTEQLEALYKDSSENAMVEAGKLLAKELIKNTKDKTKELL